MLGLWKGLNPGRFIVSLFCEFKGPTRIFQRSLRVPVRRLIVALFIVLGSSAMCVGGQLVQLSNFPVQVLHTISAYTLERAVVPAHPLLSF